VDRERFEELNRADWRALELSLEVLEKGRSIGSAEEFPALYRKVCHHLALVRHRRLGADLEARLNGLVLRGHRQLYKTRGQSGPRPWRLLLVDFPRRVRAEARLLLLASLLFYGPFAGAFAAATLRPEVALSIMPGEQIESVAEQYGPDVLIPEERGLGTGLYMFGFYVYNNVSIAFRTFASGIFAGIGSIFFLVYNGLVIGAVSARIRSLGYDEAFYSFIVGHGAFELTAIVLAGVAGLRLGLAVVSPGRARRADALRVAAKNTMPILYGCAAMLLVAAAVEAFWSPSSVPPEIKIPVGILFWLGIGAFLVGAGRTAEA
jgi:uncharacterized membrane protein SpoIIM required for sporulation